MALRNHEPCGQPRLGLKFCSALPWGTTPGSSCLHGCSYSLGVSDAEQHVSAAAAVPVVKPSEIRESLAFKIGQARIYNCESVRRSDTRELRDGLYGCLRISNFYPAEVCTMFFIADPPTPVGPGDSAGINLHGAGLGNDLAVE